MLYVKLRQGFELEMDAETVKEIEKLCKEGKEEIVQVAIDQLKKLKNVMIFAEPKAMVYACELAPEILLIFDSFTVYMLFKLSEGKVKVWVKPLLSIETHTTFLL
jgi:hypothetical protein